MSSDLQPTLSEELLNDFYAESDEHLMAIRKALGPAGTQATGPEQNQALAENLLRSFHSLKGICGIVGLGPAEALAHQAEDLLRAIFHGKTTLTEQSFDALAKAVQQLELVVAAYRARQPLPEVAPLIQELAALSPKPAGAPAPGETVQGSKPALPEGELSSMAKAALEHGLFLWQCFFKPTPALDHRGVNIGKIRSRLSQHGQILQATPQVQAGGKIAFEFIVAGPKDLPLLPDWNADGVRIAPWQVPQGDTAAQATESARSSAPGSSQGTNAFIAPSHFVRVELGRLDELMRITGEMVIHRARFEDQLNQLSHRQSGFDPRGLQEVNFAFTRQLRDLREALMRVRLVRMAEIFDRMPFVLRDLARESGKKVRLTITGQETELD